MHHILALVWFLYLNYLLGAFICFSSFLLIFAFFGIETGVHKKYVQLLLYLFEFCRRQIDAKPVKRPLSKSSSSPVINSSSSNDSINGNRKTSNLKSNSGHSRSNLSLSKSTATSDYDTDDFSDISSDLDNAVIPSPVKSLKWSIEESSDFKLSDILDFINKGVHDIVDDEVTKRFDAEQIRCWNLLTRTNRNYQFISWKLTLYWFVGFLFRFYLLFPIRLAVFVFGMIFLLGSTSFLGLIPDSAFKRWLYNRVSITSFRILGRSVSAVAHYHDAHNRPLNGGICVANHTSPFDVVMLHCDNAYALVGQLHDGYLGLMERALNRATSHVFFDRTEATDRLIVTRKMQEHKDGQKLPILIFPEGTCVNNSAVMMFKKGSFEVSSKVYPVAIKYDPIFGDPFWNSSRYGFFTYILRMMTSWAIVCDVWYLPPMERMEGENAADFARRVKGEIAKKGGLADLEWDGGLKRTAPRPELKEQVQKEFFRKISVNCKSPDLNLLNISASLTKNKSANDLIQLKLNKSSFGHERKVSTMANFSPFNDSINEDRERSESLLNNVSLSPILASPLIGSDSKILSPLISSPMKQRRTGAIILTSNGDQERAHVGQECLLTLNNHSPKNTNSNSSSSSNNLGAGIMITNNLLNNEATKTKSG